MEVSVTGPNAPAPALDPGSIHTVTVESVAFGGDGVARIGPVVVFVPLAAPGDQAEIRIAEVKPNYARSVVTRLVTPSPHRATPLCEYFGQCGGCHYQHIAYPAQQEIKHQQVRDIFQRIGRFTRVPMAPLVPCDSEYHYRIKAEFHIAPDACGFFGQDHRTVVDIAHCPLMHEKIDQQYTAAREAFRAQRPKHRPDPLTLWAGQYDIPPFNIFDERAYPRFINVKAHAKIFNVPYHGFFQVNPAMAEKLLTAVLAQVQDAADGTVVDAYCGAGFFTLFLAEKAKQVVGIEADKESAYAAVTNAKNYEYRNVTIMKGEVEVKLPAAPKEPALLVLDPPRAGLTPEALTAALALAPARIAYISCDPATQARDARLLCEKGYALTSVQPFDMFPQTKHIEVLCVLDRKPRTTSNCELRTTN
jgi:23S rRNA (uracil1939-C5)-methyltransferase